MCGIVAGQDPANYEFETRSLRLLGHATSVRLEARFWRVIEEIAASQKLPVARFLSQLYEEGLESHGNVANFASFLRCCCLDYLSRNPDVGKVNLDLPGREPAPQTAAA